MNILVVDDDIDCLKLMQELATEYDFEVKCITSGEEALSTGLGSFDLVLLDVNLGENLNGSSIREKINLAYTNLPVILWTNYTLDSLEEEPDVWTKQMTNIELVSRILSRRGEK